MVQGGRGQSAKSQCSHTGEINPNRLRRSDQNTASTSSVTCFSALAGVAMDFYINLRVNFRGNSKNFLLSGSETKSWESMEAMVRGRGLLLNGSGRSITLPSDCSYRLWLST